MKTNRKNIAIILGIVCIIILSPATQKIVHPKELMLLAQTEGGWESKGGTWTFSGKQIFGQGASDFNKAFLTNRNFSDFIYEVRLRKLSPNDGPIGLLFRYNEEIDEGYMLLVWPHGDYQVSRLVNQTRHRKGGSTPKVLNKGNSWNRIKVIGKGAQLEIYINGELQVSLEGGEYSFGRLGLVIHGGPDQQAEFELITINSL